MIIINKKILSIIVTICIFVGLAYISSTPVQAAKGTEWQEAYAEVLNSPNEFYRITGSKDLSEYNRMKPSLNFSQRDIDNNGIPELIVCWADYPTTTIYGVYTYYNGIKNLGDIGMRTAGLFISDKPEFPGLFTYSHSYNGDELFEYTTIKNNELSSEAIWQQTFKLSPDSVFYGDEELEVIIDNKLLVAELRKEIPLPHYPITDANINNVIYSYGKTQTINSHPYAIALKDYLKDGITNAFAYLEDINGDGIMEMLVSKDGLNCESLFYLYNGKLYTYDIDQDLYAGMYFSTNKHLILESYSGDGSLVTILTIKNGKVTPETELRAQLGAYPGDTRYYQDDKNISESAYDKLLEKYGISLDDRKILFVVNSNNRVEYNRKNQIEEILAMTNTVKAVPTAAKVFVDNVQIEFEAYTIENNNYFKLRDLAQAVNNTTKNFEVEWDGTKNSINLLSATSYTSIGGELNKGDGKPKSATLSTSIIYKDGKEIFLTAYAINGNNYFKLRDIAKAFDIGVTWDGATNTVGIDTSISYVEE